MHNDAAFKRPQPGLSKEKLLERNASKNGELVDHPLAELSAFGEFLTLSL